MSKIVFDESILSICDDVAEPNQLLVKSVGEPIVISGSVSDKVYIVKSGLFKLCIGHGNMSFTIEYLTPGYVTGLVNLYQATNYPCTVVSVQNSEVYEWDRVKILELMKIIPEVNNQIRYSFGSWGKRIVERIRSLVFLTPRQRVLLFMNECNVRPEYIESDLWRHLSDSDMAEYCNISVREFKAHLNQLCEEGVVEVNSEGCRILMKEEIAQHL